MKKKCRVHECRAHCCYNVPLPVGFKDAHADMVVNTIIGSSMPIDGREDLPPSELFMTDTDFSKNKCPFLRKDCKCNVYEDRPKICRIFWEDDDPLLKCKLRK